MCRDHLGWPAGCIFKSWLPEVDSCSGSFPVSFPPGTLHTHFLRELLDNEPRKGWSWETSEVIHSHLFPPSMETRAAKAAYPGAWLVSNRCKPKPWAAWGSASPSESWRCSQEPCRWSHVTCPSAPLVLAVMWGRRTQIHFRRPLWLPGIGSRKRHPS
jgi:hypothetical protein